MCIICQHFKVIHLNLSSEWEPRPGSGHRQHGCLQLYLYGVCLHTANSTWHFDMGRLRFASSVHQVTELCELGQQLTLHVLKIGAALKCLGHQVCLVSPG